MNNIRSTIVLTVSILALSQWVEGREKTIQNKQRSDIREEVAVKEAVFRDLIKSASGTGQGKDARRPIFFLRISPEEERNLLPSLRRDAPEVKSTTKMIEKRDRVVDRDTGTPGTVLNVKVKAVRGNEATADGDWWASPLGAESYVYTLKLRNGRWYIVSKKRGWFAKAVEGWPYLNATTLYS